MVSKRVKVKFYFEKKGTRCRDKHIGVYSRPTVRSLTEHKRTELQKPKVFDCG